MTPKSQRIAIAEACGYKLAYYSSISDDIPVFYKPNSKKETTSIVPDYLNDLNAMHEAEKVLHSDYTRNAQYEIELRSIVYKTKHSGCGIHFATLNATAAQRAEAFLRTFGLWKP